MFFAQLLTDLHQLRFTDRHGQCTGHRLSKITFSEFKTVIYQNTQKGVSRPIHDKFAPNARNIGGVKWRRYTQDGGILENTEKDVYRLDLG